MSSTAVRSAQSSGAPPLCTERAFWDQPRYDRFPALPMLVSECMLRPVHDEGSIDIPIGRILEVSVRYRLET